MTEKPLPKLGEDIPLSQVFISKMNVRYGEAFGKTDEDFFLSQNVEKQGVVQPMIARPEAHGYGVVQGSRRYHSLKKAGKKTVKIGKEIIVRQMTDQEAFDESLRENLPIFRRELNPIARAKAIQKLLETREASLRELARTWKVPIANLSDWMTVLELTPKMQTVVEKGLIYFTDAVNMARAGLTKDVQDQLAETVEKKGYDAFKAELAKLPSAKERRGLPAGKYSILRLTYDKTDQADIMRYNRIEKLAKVLGKEVEETAKILIDRGLERSEKAR